MISTVDRNGDGRISYSEFRWQKKCENEYRNLLCMEGCLNITLFFYIAFFFTPVPLIVGRWYIHQITRKWCFGSQGGLDKSSFGTFNLSHANLKKCLNLIKLKKIIISTKGDDGRLPANHPGGHGDEDEDCSEGQPTPSSRKQHRLEPLIICRKPFIRIYIHTCVFACIPFFKL